MLDDLNNASRGQATSARPRLDKQATTGGERCTYAESPERTILTSSPAMPMAFPFDSTMIRYASKTSSIAKGYGSVSSFNKKEA